MDWSAFGLLTALVVVWGANWPIMKVGLEHIQPLWFASIRLALGAVCLFTILAPLKRVRLPQKANLPIVMSIGLLQMALFMALINTGMQWVPPGRSAILAYTTPLWVAPGAALLLGERLSPARIAGMVFGLVGVAVLFAPQSFDWANPKTVFGNGLLLLSALVWAVTIIHVRGHRWHATPLELAPWQMLVGFVPLTLLAVVTEGAPHFDASAEFLGVILYNGPLATAFAFWVVMTINRSLPALTVSLAFLGVPVAGLLFSAALTGEIITKSSVAGLACIVLGMGVVVLDRARAQTE